MAGPWVGDGQVREQFVHQRIGPWYCLYSTPAKQGGQLLSTVNRTQLRYSVQNRPAAQQLLVAAARCKKHTTQVTGHAWPSRRRGPRPSARAGSRQTDRVGS